MNSSIVIDNMTEADWTEVRDIYTEGIHTGNATFDQRHLIGMNGIRSTYHSAG